MTGRTDVGEFWKTTFPFYDKKTCVRDPRGLNSVDRKSIFVPLFRENARQNPFFFSLHISVFDMCNRSRSKWTSSDVLWHHNTRIHVNGYFTVMGPTVKVSFALRYIFKEYQTPFYRIVFVQIKSYKWHTVFTIDGSKERGNNSTESYTLTKHAYSSYSIKTRGFKSGCTVTGDLGSENLRR